MAALSGHRGITGVGTALVMAALVAGPVLGAPFAYAKDGYRDTPLQSQPDNRTVSFVGGSMLNLLVCKSEPNPARMTVPDGSRVTFVNRLGQAATLRVDGEELVGVASGQGAPLMFRYGYGPVAVSMTFPCGTHVAAQFSAVSITVTRPSRPAASHSPSASPSASTPAPQSLAATVRTSRSGRETPAPMQSGATPPAASPTAARSSPGVALSVTNELVDSGEGGGPVAVEPLVRAVDPPRESSSGLLAIIAALCATGVTIAVIRSIISKRTFQAHTA